MKRLRLLAGLSLALCSTSAFAAEEVVCESRDKSKQFCEMDTFGEVHMVRQLSHAACIEDRTWGISKHGVWVDQGCRAVFSKSDHHSADNDWHGSNGADRYQHHSAGWQASEGGGNDEGRAYYSSPRGLPLLNASCPGNLEIHVAQGGPIFINGDEARLKKYNDNYYEGSLDGVTISLSRNPDETWSMSYTGPGRANGICRFR